MSEIKICPLCGKKYDEHPAISRTKGQEEICTSCGTLQAVTAYALHRSPQYSTRGIHEYIQDDKCLEFVIHCMSRHIHFDWGEMDEEDLHTNDLATVDSDRIFSSYDIPEALRNNAPDDKIWIITEADRSATTVLFPSEY